MSEILKQNWNSGYATVADIDDPAQGHFYYTDDAGFYLFSDGSFIDVTFDDIEAQVGLNTTALNTISNADLVDIVAKKHYQNTDTGTTEADFDIQSGGNKANLDASTATTNISIDLNDVNDILAGKMRTVSFPIQPDGWVASTGVLHFMKDIGYGNGVFCSITATAFIYRTTDDGDTWGTTTTATQNWTGIAYGNATWVIVNTDGATYRVATSINDGSSWVNRTASEANAWQSVCYGDKFVAVSNGGTNRAMTSPDGITWTARTPSAQSWTSICYGDGLYVIVAGDGSVETSPDGITWTARTPSASSAWTSVCYGDGLFVAVSSSATDTIMTSPDGITWTSRVPAETNTWKRVAYCVGFYIAVSSNGTNRTMYSTDGINWYSQAQYHDKAFTSIVSNGVDTAIAVSDTSPYPNDNAMKTTLSDPSLYAFPFTGLLSGTPICAEGAGLARSIIDGTTI